MQDNFLKNVAVYHVDLSQSNRSLQDDMKSIKNQIRRRKMVKISEWGTEDNMIKINSDDEAVIIPKYCQWGTSDGVNFLPSSKTVNFLTPGVYEIDSSPQTGIYFEKIPVKTEGLIRFNDTNSDKVVGEIQKFWDRESIFKDYGIAYKRGIMLYGPPGSGKSCTVQLIMQDVVQRNGVVFEFGEPHLFIDGMRIFRQIQPETPVVVIMEDIDSTLENSHDESEILNILDGVNNMHKVVFLATTNYPDKLGHRIMNRPSRFDKRFRIGFPSKESRKAYFEHIIGAQKIDELKIDIEKWIEDTDEFSIAHLKELFVAVVILGDEYDDALETLRKMKDEVQDKDYEAHIGLRGPDKNKDFYN